AAPPRMQEPDHLPVFRTEENRRAVRGKDGERLSREIGEKPIDTGIFFSFLELRRNFNVNTMNLAGIRGIRRKLSFFKKPGEASCRTGIALAGFRRKREDLHFW